MTIHLNRSASRLVERELLPPLRLAARGHGLTTFEAQKLLDLFTPAKPSIKKRASKKAKKDRASGEREAHRLETSAIYRAVEKRAGWFCECGCLRVMHLEMDHFYGRGKEPQTVETCWLLARTCHVAKGLNMPTRAYWDALFKAHCERHGIVFRPRLVKSAALSVANQKGVGQ